MKTIGLMAVLLAVAAPAGAQTAAAGGATAPALRVMAHRACWEGGAPEVSLAAITACEPLQPAFVEVDVRTTSDGELVLMHDDTVDRTTDGSGVVAEMTAAQIRALRLRAGEGGADAPLTDEHVPTLAEGLEAARGKFILHLDVKNAQAEAIVQVVKRLGMAGQVTSWVFGNADELRRAESPFSGTVGMIPVISECGDNPSSSCRIAPMAPLTDYDPVQPDGVYMISTAPLADAGAQHFIADALSVARPAGSWIMVRTLFDVDNFPIAERRGVYQQLIDLGVHVIMTDHPGELRDLIHGAAGN